MRLEIGRVGGDTEPAIPVPPKIEVSGKRPVTVIDINNHGRSVFITLAHSSKDEL